MKDHLDAGTSVSAGLTDTGLELKAKSRFVAAIDRLSGNAIDFFNIPMEARNNRRRATSEGEVAVIEAITRTGLKQIEQDPEFARRVLEQEYKKLARKQENVDGVLYEALEDLRHNPASEAESKSGEPELDPEFLSSFEPHAEKASTERLKQKWGRVLSAEIRDPGTFNAKAMRVVDEIDAGTAAFFQKLCESIVGNGFPKCLIGERSFGEISNLVMAGLIVEPGLIGHIIHFSNKLTNDGTNVWALMSEGRAVTFRIDAEWQPGSVKPESPLTDAKGVPALPVYLLTDAGIAIAKIADRGDGLSRYADLLEAAYPTAGVAVLPTNV
jgi:hypothetical protein